MKRLGIIGLGNIGFSVARAVLDGTVNGMQVVAYLDQNDCPNGVELQKLSSSPVAACTDFDAFITSGLDIVLEAASPSVVQAYAHKIVEHGVDFMMMSVGGIIAPGFLDELGAAAEAHGATVYVPCGAITGLNVLYGGAIAGLDEVVLQSTKSVAGLRDAPYIVKNGIHLEALTEPTIVYRGNVYDAVTAFPQNVNIAASLALSGFGCDKTMVEIVCDPHASQISQRVLARGAFGDMEISLHFLPSPNKRSSYMAILGAISSLKKYASPVKLGY